MTTKTFGHIPEIGPSRVSNLNPQRWLAGGVAMAIAAAVLAARTPHSGLWRAEAALLAGGLLGALLIRNVRLMRRADQQSRAWQDAVIQMARDMAACMHADEAAEDRSHEALQMEIARRKQAETALRDLSGRLLRLQDEERRRIARELHDSTSQNLVAVSMNIAYMQADASANARTRSILQDCAALVEQCSTEIRTISYLLHPPVLDELGLAAALGWAAGGFSRRSGIAVDVDVPEELGRFSPDVELAVFRIVQEALTNIHRHSRSRTAMIAVSGDAAGLSVSIEDHGRGLPQQVLASACGPACVGVGIAGMRERIRQLGGVFEITSNSRGTRITARVPLAESAAGLVESEPRAANARPAA